MASRRLPLRNRRPVHETFSPLAIGDDLGVTALSVNVNKIAVLRNSRGGNEPDVIRAARTCLYAGAHGITVHPRPDQRHIRIDDVLQLAALSREQGFELNLEGNPFAPAREGYPGFVALCETTRPAQATLVPDGDGQITSDHGFEFAQDAARLQPLIARLKSFGCRVSLFVDAGVAGLQRARDIGADRIEIYTGPFAEACAREDAASALRACIDTARLAQSLGLGVNAGHDLSQANLMEFLESVPGVLEVSIGHALISEALYAGLEHTVQNYLSIISSARN